MFSATGFFRVRCANGGMHKIAVKSMRLKAVSHTPEEMALLRRMGERPGCARFDGARAEDFETPPSLLKLELSGDLRVKAFPKFGPGRGTVELRVMPAILNGYGRPIVADEGRGVLVGQWDAGFTLHVYDAIYSIRRVPMVWSELAPIAASEIVESVVQHMTGGLVGH